MTVPRNVLSGSSATNNNIGRLASITTSSHGHSESYSFDNKGRLATVTTNADTSYQTDFGFDPVTGLLDSYTYPESTSGVRLRLKYDYAYGILKEVSNYWSPSTVFWEGLDMDARGNIVHEKVKSGMQTSSVFDEVTGLMHSREVYVPSGPTIQHLKYTWDGVGNLTSREDVNRGLTEVFAYDDLHRLDHSVLDDGTPTQNLDLTYDDTVSGYNGLGNIRSKSDVSGGNYGFDANQKHQVTSAGGKTFQFDDNGNQTNRGSDDVEWTSYQYPSKIENGSKSHEFFYDGYRNRWKQVYDNGAASETTIFVGGNFEKRTEGGVSHYRHYIYAHGRAVALNTRATTGTVTNRYLHLDYQGSLSEVSKDNGNVHVSASYSAFGERRDPDDWAGAPSGTDLNALLDTTQRGYTFHTHLEASALIHMNGRVMDAHIGRFLSADPYVQSAGMTQAFNRYSYVFNNPMTYTDPSGFLSLGGLWDAFNPKIFVNVNLSRSTRNRMQTAPPPIGCFAPASRCYGGSVLDKAVDVIADILIGPRPTYNGIPGLGEYNGPWGYGAPCDLCLNAFDLGGIIEGAKIGVRYGIFDWEEPLGDSYWLEAATLIPVFKVAKLTVKVAKAAKKVPIELPDRLVRVVDARFANSPTLGVTDDVFVAAADDVAGITNSADLGRRLTLLDDAGQLRSGPLAIIEFDNPVTGLASPVFRANPGFLQGGFTRGGAREFVLPNGAVNDLTNVTRRIVE